MGVWHACAIRDSGELACWGEETGEEATAPSGRYLSVSAGYGYTCAVDEAGAPSCWGATYDEKEFRAPASEPDTPYRMVSAGVWYACAVLESGQLVCWGTNAPGAPVDLPTGRYQSVSVGGDAMSPESSFACAVGESGELDCWALGDPHGTVYGPEGRSLLRATPEGHYHSISAGGAHVCAVRVEGGATCWGGYRYGAAGAFPGRYQSISAGDYHACALQESGEMDCIGVNFPGGRPSLRRKVTS